LPAEKRCLAASDLQRRSHSIKTLQAWRQRDDSPMARLSLRDFGSATSGGSQRLQAVQMLTRNNFTLRHGALEGLGGRKNN
jgi:hypothetical protein